MPILDEEPFPQFNVQGPALFYIGSPAPDGAHTIHRIDIEPGIPQDPRNRALCRALLRHALALLDATEPTSPTGRAAH